MYLHGRFIRTAGSPARETVRWLAKTSPVVDCVSLKATGGTRLLFWWYPLAEFVRSFTNFRKFLQFMSFWNLTILSSKPFLSRIRRISLLWLLDFWPWRRLRVGKVWNDRSFVKRIIHSAQKSSRILPKHAGAAITHTHTHTHPKFRPKSRYVNDDALPCHRRVSPWHRARENNFRARACQILTLPNFHLSRNLRVDYSIALWFFFSPPNLYVRSLRVGGDLWYGAR